MVILTYIQELGEHNKVHGAYFTHHCLILGGISLHTFVQELQRTHDTWDLPSGQL